MVLWFVLALVASLPFGAREAVGGLHEGHESVICQLLMVRHLRVEMGLNIQGVDRVRIGAVTLLLEDKIQEFKLD